MKKSIAMLGMVLMLAGCAAAESEPLAAEPAALVEICLLYTSRCV